MPLIEQSEKSQNTNKMSMKRLDQIISYGKNLEKPEIVAFFKKLTTGPFLSCSEYFR